MSLPVFFFFNDTATTEIYTLSLHDALPIFNGIVSKAPAKLQHRFGIVPFPKGAAQMRSEEHTSELQSQSNLVCRLLLEKKKKHNYFYLYTDTTHNYYYLTSH